MTGNEVQVRRLRVRGAYPVARRLTMVARTHLPAALDGALAGLDLDGTPVRLDRLDVVFDLDPTDYDDVTLAALWADRIRVAAVANIGRRSGSRSSDRPAPLADHPDPAAPAPAVTVPGPTRLPEVRPAGATSELAGTEAAESGDPERQPASARVARFLVTGPGVVSGEEPAAPVRARLVVPVTPPSGPGADGRPPVPVDRRLSVAAGAGTVVMPAGSEPELVPAPVVRLAPSSASPSSGTGEAGAVPGPVPRSAGSAGDLSPSMVAGLLLLYPWLPRFCGLAVELSPGRDPVPARRAALAALAGPGTSDDPLLRLLSGDPDWTSSESRYAGPAGESDSAPAPEVTEAVAAAAVEVLAAFAGLLPGFAASSPDFVRTQWVRRPATLLPEPAGPVWIRLGRLPLDVVLDRLPYPLGAVRLAWTPPLAVTWEPV